MQLGLESCGCSIFVWGRRSPDTPQEWMCSLVWNRVVAQVLHGESLPRHSPRVDVQLGLEARGCTSFVWGSRSPDIVRFGITWLLKFCMGESLPRPSPRVDAELGLELRGCSSFVWGVTPQTLPQSGCAVRFGIAWLLRFCMGSRSPDTAPEWMCS